MAKKKNINKFKEFEDFLVYPGWVNDVLESFLAIVFSVPKFTSFFIACNPLHLVVFSIAIVLMILFNIAQGLNLWKNDNKNIVLTTNMLAVFVETSIFLTAIIAGIVLPEYITFASAQTFSYLVPYFFIALNAIDMFYHIFSAFVNWNQAYVAILHGDEKTYINCRKAILIHGLSALKDLLFIGILLTTMFFPMPLAITLSLGILTVLTIGLRRYMMQQKPESISLIQADPEDPRKSIAYQTDDISFTTPEQELFLGCSPRGTERLEKYLDNATSDKNRVEREKNAKNKLIKTLVEYISHVRPIKKQLVMEKTQKCLEKNEAFDWRKVEIKVGKDVKQAYGSRAELEKDITQSFLRGTSGGRAYQFFRCAKMLLPDLEEDEFSVQKETHLVTVK